jgi:hypothetical protein
MHFDQRAEKVQSHVDSKPKIDRDIHQPAAFRSGQAESFVLVGNPLRR